MVSLYMLEHGHFVGNGTHRPGNGTGYHGHDGSLSEEDIIFIVFIILYIIGLVANALSFAAILNIKRITARMILICNLALVDGLVFLFLLLSDCVHVIYECRNSMDFVLLSLLEMAGLTLLTLGLEMYIAVCKPLHYSSWITKRWSWTALALIWGFVVGKLFILILSNVHDFCTYGDTVEGVFQIQIKVQYYGSILIFATCMAASTVFYIRIFLDVRSNQWAYDKARRTSGSGPSREDRQRHVKTTITLFLLYGTLALSWGPWVIATFLSNVVQVCDPEICPDVLLTSFILVWINSLLDPIIYGIRLPDIRQGYRRLFRRCCKCRQNTWDYDAPYTSRSCNSTRINSTSL
ncbi:adrenocorticotropic hormone receptor isoform X2 [Lingula anatina]|nr:adrenocorticotropic hormone receptor isoform X2 [Lingula anatina]XP_013412400.1 adrenocorticotropic hormone receptor isoform X2 [Lingula anatina]XP_013412408.1 adrenocorticotropic hormone receptor isoform X2 [Lingula anatina]|eukprot:XP_013412391.1 adrenocorticotropic hormone receptor isoform X2 [Lingula anatina]